MKLKVWPGDEWTIWWWRGNGGHWGEGMSEVVHVLVGVCVLSMFYNTCKCVCCTCMGAYKIVE